jgi:hypothetical protein
MRTGGLAFEELEKKRVIKLSHKKRDRTYEMERDHGISQS